MRPLPARKARNDMYFRKPSGRSITFGSANRSSATVGATSGSPRTVVAGGVGSSSAGGCPVEAGHEDAGHEGRGVHQEPDQGRQDTFPQARQDRPGECEEYPPVHGGRAEEITDGSHCLLTPKDVREKGFTFSTRRKHDWYDADEVDAFLDLVEQTIKELGRYPALLEMDKQTLQAENTRLLLRLNQKKPRTHAHPKHIRKHHQRHTKHQPQNTSTTNNRKHKP